MIKPEEIKDKNFKIFLGMPMYGGMLTEPTLHGLLEIQNYTANSGVKMRVQTMGNESLITRARNTLVSQSRSALNNLSMFCQWNPMSASINNKWVAAKSVWSSIMETNVLRALVIKLSLPIVCTLILIPLFWV